MSEKSDRFRREVKEALAELFSEEWSMMEGDGISLIKEGEFHTDFLSVFTGIDKISDGYNFLVESGRTLKIIDQYWEEYRSEPLELKGPKKWTISGSIMEKNHNTTFTQLHKDITNPGIIAAARIKEFWNVLFLPRLNKYSHIHELNESENKSIEKGSLLGMEGFWFRKMIVARLAGDPRYDELCHYIRNMHAAYQEDSEDTRYFKNNLWVVEKLYEKLEKIKPLSNPDLTQSK